MNVQIEISGKTVKVTLSEAANQALQQRTQPLQAEMELYFSCLIRKKVRFYENMDTPQGVQVKDNLYINFRPVMTKTCGKDYAGDEPPLTDFPIIKPEAFVPHWLTIDYRAGEWRGEFGFVNAA